MMASAIPTLSKIGKSIRLNKHGCVNRPFYHIVVQKTRDNFDGPVIEQVGSYDAMPNSQNEKLVAVNFERVQYWIGQGAELSGPVAQLLGLSGFLPIHPTTVIQSWRNRREPPRERKLQPIKGVAPPLDNPKI